MHVNLYSIRSTIWLGRPTSIRRRHSHSLVSRGKQAGGSRQQMLHARTDVRQKKRWCQQTCEQTPGRGNSSDNDHSTVQLQYMLLLERILHGTMCSGGLDASLIQLIVRASITGTVRKVFTSRSSSRLAFDPASCATGKWTRNVQSQNSGVETLARQEKLALLR
jgi:hypothetical protein